MYELLVKLMFIAAIAQLGISHFTSKDLNARANLQILQKHSADVTQVKWKPISMFPREANRFK